MKAWQSESKWEKYSQGNEERETKRNKERQKTKWINWKRDNERERRSRGELGRKKGTEKEIIKNKQKKQRKQ